MKKKLTLVAMLATIISAPAFAATASQNACLAHWEDHTFGDQIQMGGCHLTDSDMTELSKIVYRRHLKQLNLRNNDFTAQGLKNLAQYDNATIKILWLDENHLTVDAVAELKHFYALDIVSFSNNDMGDAGAIALAADRRLNEIYLNNTNIQSIDAIKALAAGNTEVLSLRNNNLTDAMIEPLAKNKLIKVLNLTNNEISAAGAIELAKNNVLTQLYLNKNHIGDNGVAAFGNNNTLQLLSVEDNNLTKVGMTGLANNITLKKINISNNPIDDDGVAKLAANTNIELLDASYTGLDNKSLNTIVDNTSIKSLFTDGNHINDTDAKLLAKSELKLLSANNNDIGPEGGIALAQDTTLKQLFINKNHVGDAAAFEFANVTNLSKLFIMYNDLTQAGMNALSTNFHFETIWYGESEEAIKKINRVSSKQKAFLDKDQLSKELVNSKI